VAQKKRNATLESCHFQTNEVRRLKQKLDERSFNSLSFYMRFFLFMGASQWPPWPDKEKLQKKKLRAFLGDPRKQNNILKDHKSENNDGR
jgi:hypothetical protein